MKPTVYVIGAAWLLSLGAAFLVGKAGRSDASEPDSPRLESRTSPRNPSSGRGSQSGASRKAAPPTFSSSADGQAARIIARDAPRQAVIELAHLVDPVERAKGFLALLETMEADEFRDVVADFRALGITEQRMSEYGMIMHAWGKIDPEGALDYAMRNTGTPFARQTVLASWAAENPEAAIAFAEQNHQGKGANPLLVGVIRGIAPTDLNRATELLQNLPYSDERGQALRSMLPFVLATGVDGAIGWTGGLADERLRSGALAFILSDVSNSQPERAAEILVTLPDRRAALGVADEIGGDLARNDLNQAITWSARLDAEVRSEAVEGIISYYASQDPQAASQWMDSLSSNTNLDAAIRRFAWHTQAKNPELATNWVHRMQDERRRNEMYSSVLDRWWRADQSAADNWIQSTPDLPERIRGLPERMRSNQQHNLDLRSSQ